MTSGENDVNTLAISDQRIVIKLLILNTFSGRREWDRTTDHHHVKVVLYH
jgi:hypothetical protein